MKSCRVSLGSVLVVCLAVVLGATAASAQAPPPKPAAPGGAPTAQEATAWVSRAEQELLDLWIRAERASYVLDTYITDDTEVMTAQAREAVIARTMELAKESTRFDGVKLPEDVARKIQLIRLSLTLPAPSDPAKQKEVTELAASMESRYGKGVYCRKPDECLDINALSKIMAESRDPNELLDVWRGWHAISPPMRPQYQRFVQLANEGAKELGYPDVGALWRANYDMPPDAFSAEVERLWNQVKPLYESLHCYVRTKLGEKYGTQLVPPGKPIPAHLLGNMWSQSWSNIDPLLAPPNSDPGYDLTKIIEARKIGPQDMVRYGERFFTSLGFEPLPKTFWERSMFVKPRDRDVVCHASAWDIDWVEDLRLKMCIEPTAEDFVTVHHELGHNFYQRAYDKQPPLFRSGANDGFHEAIGDTVALSVTPAYLVKVGLLDKEPPAGGDLGEMMNLALDKIAFLPFGLLIDQWRWKVFSGEIKPEDYNKAWWDLRLKYQGIVPPVPRTEADFDPGAKYHVPSNVPYTRYFLADILQFQFHRALCREAGFTGPLNRCSIYANDKAGERFRAMLAMGQSRPWPEELKALTGETQMDATAILDYFAPLKQWLDQQNQGQTCGW